MAVTTPNLPCRSHSGRCASRLILFVGRLVSAALTIQDHPRVWALGAETVTDRARMTVVMETPRTMPSSSIRNASFCRQGTDFPDLSVTMTGTRTRSERAVSFTSSRAGGLTRFSGATGVVLPVDGGYDSCRGESCWPIKGDENARIAASNPAGRIMECALV